MPHKFIPSNFTPNIRTRVPCLAAVAAALLAFAWTTSPAGAEDLPPTSEFFDEFDTNSDGKVTSEEFRGSAAIFRLLDKDGDGSITPTELGLPVDYKPDPRRQKRKAGGEARAKGGGKPGKGGGKAARGAGAKRREEMRKRLLAMDTDKDGRVTRTEWTGPEQAFDRLDRNKDGVLDKADRARKGATDRPEGRRKDGPSDGPTDKQRSDRVRAHFKKVDKNGDGSLTADEAPNPELLKAADGNGDGAVTLEEFVAFVKKRAQGRREEGRREEGGREGRSGTRKRGGKMSAGMLRRWDRDGDGKVSAEEFPGRDEAFKRFDSDKDGFLTPADVTAGERGKKKQADTSFEACDKDGDGRLTRIEFPGTNAEWRVRDQDGDGYLTRAEAGK